MKDLRGQGNIMGRVVYWMATGGALWFLAAFVVLAFMRAGFGFDIEWIEGLMVQQTQRVIEGLNLYPPPSGDFVPAPYPPMYFYLSALLSFVFGHGQMPLRIVSTLSTLGVCAAIFAFVHRESGKVRPGILAAGLFAATYSINAYWFDLARVDMLFLALVFWAAYFVRFGTRLHHDLAAAALCVAAVLAKQSAVLAVVAFSIWILFKHRRALPGFVLGGIVIGGAALAAMYALYGEWFFYYLLHVPASHGILQRRLGSFWLDDWLMPFGPASLIALCYFSRKRKKLNWLSGGDLFYALFFIALFVTAFMGRIKVGGADNAMIPLHAGVSLLCGLSIAAVFSESKTIGRLCLVLLSIYILQLATLAYNPARFVPTPEIEQRLKNSLDTLAKIPGDVYVMRDPNFTAPLGHSCGAHMCTAKDTLYEASLHDDNLQKILKPFENKAYSAVVIRPERIPKYCRKALLKNYRPSKECIDVILWQNKKGFTLDRQTIYLPKDEEDEE